MQTKDREPQYMGTHKGITRVQLGWTTLYFREGAYTHAVGTLYGTQEEPTSEDITAARKVIPLSPRPPMMAHSPVEKRQPSREPDAERKASPKTTPHAKKAAAPAPKAAPQAKTPKKHSPTRTPSAKKTPAAPRAAAPKARKKHAAAPIETMAALEASLTAGDRGAKAEGIDSLAKLEAVLEGSPARRRSR
jgi:hypothetical protein